MRSPNYSALENTIDHVFEDQNLIKNALTHSSTGKANNYERLEFLGDRVLGLIVSEALFKKFPNEPEGDLAKRLSALVQGEFIAKIATEISLGQYVEFSDSERMAGGAENPNILADVFESMIGALYLESGLEKCRALILKLWADHFDHMSAPPLHPKTALQEWMQAQNLGLPSYEIVKQSGPDHAPLFDICLKVTGYDDIIVQGRSRQDAEKRAATQFIEHIK